MKAFGLELRRVGSMPGLYSEIDSVLQRYDIPQGGVSKEVQTATVAHALQNMMRVDHHFSVCAVRDCIKVCQVCVSEERMAVYNAAHCISWNAMTHDYRQSLIAMVLDDFRCVLNPVS